MNWAKFREQMSVTFNSQELRTLCFDLGVDYDALHGEGKDDKIRELITFLQRNCRIPDLITRLQQIRPSQDWPELSPPNTPSPTPNKQRPKQIIASTLILALIAIITLFFITQNNKPADPLTERSSPNRNNEQITPDSITTETTNTTDCLDPLFAHIEADRQATIEVGETARNVIIADEDRDSTEYTAPYGLKLTKDGEMIAAFTYKLRAQPVLFKIITIVDAQCAPLETYYIAEKPTGEGVFDDNDHLILTLSESRYSLGFNFQGKQIRFNFIEQ